MLDNVNVNGLRVLREQLGFTQDALGQSVGVARQTIAAWEKGESSPTVAQLFALARALSVPTEALLGTQGQNDVALLFRADQPDALSPEMRAVFAHTAATYAEVERLVGEVPAVPPAWAMDGYDSGLVENFAGQIRDWLGVDDGPLLDVIDRLEVLGVKVLVQPLPAGISGFSAYTNEWGAVIFVNRDHPGERQCFTALHELGHLVLHRREYDGPSERTRKRGDPREKAVQHFAGAVLLPSAVLSRELRSWKNRWLPEPLLLDLKQRYRVSMQTVIFRAHQLGLITAEQAGKQVGVLRRRYGPDSEPAEHPPLHEPTRMRRLVFRALLADQMTVSRAAEVLSTTIPLVRDELRGWLEVCPS